MARTNAKTLESLAADYEEWAKENTKWVPHWTTYRDFYDGKQLTTKQERILRQRGEPIVVDNVIREHIHTMLGIEIRSRTDVRALPRTPQDEDGASAATDALRFVDDNTNLDARFSEAAEYEWVEHTGALEFYLKDPARGELGTRRLHSWQIYWDATSVELDYSDSRVRGTMRWMDRDEAKALYPGAANTRAINSTFKHQLENYTPKHVEWADSKRGRILVFQTYTKDAQGVWQYALWTRGGFLKERYTDETGAEQFRDSPAESLYLDDNGKPMHPYEWQSAYIDRNGMRYGEIRARIDLQKEINKRRSKGLHYLNTNQLHYEKNSIADPGKAAREGRKPDGIIEYAEDALVDGRARFEKNVDLANGNMVMLQETRQRVSLANAEAIAGQGGESGRHLQQQQQGELIPLSPAIDRHQQLKRRSYRKLLMMIKQFWTDERWVRVRDTDGKVKFTPVNVETAKLSDKQMLDMGLTAKALEGGEIPAVLNPLPDMDFDIILDDVPDIATLQQEQFASLANMGERGMLQLPPEAWIELSTVPNKKQILDMMKDLAEENKGQAEQQQQVQMQALQLQFDEMKAKIEKMQSETEENRADTELKTVQATNAAYGAQ